MTRKRDPRQIKRVGMQPELEPESAATPAGPPEAVDPAPPQQEAGSDEPAPRQGPVQAKQHRSRQAVRHEEPSTLFEEQFSKKRRVPKRALALAGCLVLLALAGVLVKFIVDVTHPQNLFGDTQPTPASPAAVTPLPGEPTPTPEPDKIAGLLTQADLDFMKNRVNILALGLDESTERESWRSFRSDTMILISINFDTKAVDMISVPRDSYVKLYDSRGDVVRNELDEPAMAKVNSAFPRGGASGFQYAMQTVSKLLGGVPIHYYVGFNMNVVKDMVDAMGGVYYDVDIHVSMNGRTLAPGYQHLNGQQVLDYSRMRKGSSDIARIDRQQRILTAIFQQLKSTGQIVNIPDIYQAVESNMNTNLSFAQIVSLALLGAQMDVDQLHRHTVDGGFLTIANVSYWGVDTQGVERMVREVFGVKVTVDPDVDLMNIQAAIEANRAAIAQELELARQAVEAGTQLLTLYGAQMDAATTAQLSLLIENAERAVEEENKTTLDAATAALHQMIASLRAVYEPWQPTVTDPGGNEPGGGGGLGF